METAVEKLAAICILVTSLSHLIQPQITQIGEDIRQHERARQLGYYLSRSFESV